MLLFLLFACDPDPCDPSALSAGDIEATINEDIWNGAGASWLPAGDGIQIVSELSEGWRITLVANNNESSFPVGEALDALPLTVSLAGSDGFALVYPESGGSLTSRDHPEGGTLTLVDIDEGEVLSACFSFTASGDGRVLRFKDGLLRASKSALAE